MRLMVVAGTRPELIRLSVLINSWRQSSVDELILVHTGQNWDPNLSDVFFSDLDVAPPDYQLQLDTTTLGSSLGSLMPAVEGVIQQEAPDAFLVLGDTNSALALLIARRMHVPTYHLEAGNRSFDANVPEEVNRRLLDHTSDFNLAYSEAARRNLLQEGLEPRRIAVTGSPLRELFTHHAQRLGESVVLGQLGLRSDDYLVASVHREENVDDPDRLSRIVDLLSIVSQETQRAIVVSTHPRTAKRLENLGLDMDGDCVRWLPPFGFWDYCSLQANAWCVMSDSGSLHEEAAILGFPAVSLRNAVERPEAVEAGVVPVVGIDARQALEGIAVAKSAVLVGSVGKPYPEDNFSARVTNFVHSTWHQHRLWSGLF